MYNVYTLIDKLNNCASPALDREIAIYFGIIAEEDKDKDQWIPTFTTSLEEVIWLVKEKRPGWTWSVQERPYTSIGYIHNNESHFVGMGSAPNPKKRWYEFRHNEPQIALLIALLESFAYALE